MPQHHTIIAGVIGAGVTLVAAHQMLDQRRAQAEAEEREAELRLSSASASRSAIRIWTLSKHWSRTRRLALLWAASAQPRSGL